MEPKGSLLLRSHDFPLVPNLSQLNPVHVSFLKEKEYVGTSSRTSDINIKWNEIKLN